jgi:hypothetical protein
MPDAGWKVMSNFPSQHQQPTVVRHKYASLVYILCIINAYIDMPRRNTGWSGGGSSLTQTGD